MNQIQLPLGMRDLVFEECSKKSQLKTMLLQLFNSFGYREIMTPCIEYDSIYQIAYGEKDDSETYKFFDQDNKTLSLRKDMTVPIARVCASKLINIPLPYRLCYCSEVYKKHQSFDGKRSEVSDCGIELIGMDESSDIEVLNLAFQAMDLLNKNYTIEIGNGNFYRVACEKLNIDSNSFNILADLIDRKSIVDLKQYLESLSLSKQAQSFFLALPLLNGGQDAINKAMELSFTDDLKNVVVKLQKLYDDLKQLGYENKVSFDFGKIPHLNYYTGIIFQAFIEGSGVSVLSGGRYDTLLSKFGRDLPACGFSVKLDYCIDSIETVSEKNIIIRYPKGKETEALLLSNQLHKQGNIKLEISDEDLVEVIK